MYQFFTTYFMNIQTPLFQFLKILTFLCFLDDIRITVNDTNIVGTTYRKNIQAGLEYQLIALFNNVNINAMTALLTIDSNHELIVVTVHIKI